MYCTLLTGEEKDERDGKNTEATEGCLSIESTGSYVAKRSLKKESNSSRNGTVNQVVWRTEYCDPREQLDTHTHHVFEYCVCLEHLIISHCD